MKKLIKNQKYNFRVEYYADDNGHIWSKNKNDYLTEYDDKNGYKKVVLMTEDRPKGKGHRFSVHRLIMTTFEPVANMNELTVDHIDGDVTNNQLSNLRWAAMKENLENPNTKPNRRCYDQDGTHNTSSVFTMEKLTNLIKDVNSGLFKKKQILEKYDICDETLRKILAHISYKKETENIIIKPKFIDDMTRDTKGEKNGRAKLNEERVKEIIKLLLTKKYNYPQLAKKFNVSVSTISNIKNKKTWKHLTENIQF